MNETQPLPTDAEIEAAWTDATGSSILPYPDDMLAFARAVEAEVRARDEALIRQLVDAMEGVKALNMGGKLALWTAEFDRLLSAIAAGRARLKGKP